MREIDKTSMRNTGHKAYRIQVVGYYGMCIDELIGEALVPYSTIDNISECAAKFAESLPGYDTASSVQYFIKSGRVVIDSGWAKLAR